MTDKKLDFDNVIKQSGNASVFVYVDTTAIAYAMLCCFGALAVTNSSDSGKNNEKVMKKMLSSFDQFLKEDKKRQEQFIQEVQKSMKT